MTIFKQAIKRIFQNKIRLAILLVMPVFFILMFATMDDRSLTIGVVDKDQSTLSKKLTDSLGEINQVKVLMLDETAVFDKTVSYQVDYSIILEPGFAEKLAGGQKPEIKELYLVEKEKLFYARVFIENYVTNIRLLARGTGFDSTMFSKALEEFERSKLVVNNESAGSKQIPQSRLAMGFLVQFMLYMSVVTAGLILEDKNSGVFFRVFYAPVSLKRYLVENMAAFLIIGSLQVILILSFLKYLFGMNLGNHSSAMYTLFLMFSLVCISLGMYLVSLFKKPIQAYTTIFLATSPLVMLGSCYWPPDLMPSMMNKIAQFIPTSWVMDGVDKILFEGENLAGISMDILMLAIFAGIFLAAGLLKKVDISK